MTIEFADTWDATLQDSVCSILASLSLMADTKRRMRNFSGRTLWLYRHELEFHYQSAVLNSLRLLGLLTHSGIGTQANADRICERGHTAFEDIAREIAGYFDTEDELVE